MKRTVNILELFSGIGGFSVGLKEAGFNISKHYFSEVDKHAIANYKYNFKDAEYIGSVKHVRNIIRTVNTNRNNGGGETYYHFRIALPRF
jgi:site-specific DNA-cytosine methylase